MSTPNGEGFESVADLHDYLANSGFGSPAGPGEASLVSLFDSDFLDDLPALENEI